MGRRLRIAIPKCIRGARMNAGKKQQDPHADVLGNVEELSFGRIALVCLRIDLGDRDHVLEDGHRIFFQPVDVAAGESEAG